MTEATELPEVSVPMLWQSDSWDLVNNQIQDEKLPHALLLVGPANIGKNRFARSLARLLLCQSPSAGHNCGKCHSCEMSRAGTHGDFRWLQPEEKSRVIKIDQIREVIDFTNKTASFGRRKVIVFSPAESMNTNAANALLKALEEPSEDTFLILVCHRLQGLSATIRSRTALIRFPLPSTEQSLVWLDGLTQKRDESEKLLKFANGCPMLAAQIYTQGDVQAAAAIPTALDGLLAGRASVPQLVALLGKLALDEALAVLVTYLQMAIRGAAAAGMTAQRTQRYFLILDEVGRQQRAVVAGSNPSPQLLLESLVAHLHKELGETRP